MKTIFVVATVMVSLVSAYPATSVHAAASCPSPAPKCTSSSSTTLKRLAGTFGCSFGATESSGTNGVQIDLATIDGKGHVSGKEANNDDSPTGNTYEDFSSRNNAFTGTYCVNSDGTGYYFPSASSGDCPSALVIDSAGSEIRLIGSYENEARSGICKKQ